MGILCFQADHIPDLSLNKYQSLSDSGIEGVLNRHESFLRQWHGICKESGTSFHLLYTYVAQYPMGERLMLFFILQGDEKKLKAVEPLFKKSPLSDFYNFENSEIPVSSYHAGATLIKKERIADIYNPLANSVSSVHYVPQWEMNKSGRLYDLFRIMETIGNAESSMEGCAFRIDLYPADESQKTRTSFDPIVKKLRGENEIKLLRETEGLNKDNYAKDICSEYEDWVTSIETTPHFRVNIYGFADSLFKAKIILNAAGSESLNKGDFSIAPIKPDTNGMYNPLSRMGTTADDYCFFPKQSSLKSWSTTFCLSEVAPFFRLPALFEGEHIEIKKETSPVRLDSGIYLGQDINGYPVYFDTKDLTRHAFFTGMPGSGKTNTMLHLAMELKRKGIPFLALEPAKKEYRALLGCEDMKDVFLFSPHLQSHFPLRINPLEFPKGVRLSEHLNALLDVFKGSFVLEGPTYKFLSSSLEKAYVDLGWDIEDIYDDHCAYQFPTLKDVYNNLQNEIEKSSYDSEYKGNVRAFLQVRLGSLMERDTGELYSCRYSTLKPEEWIRVSAIVELEVLGEQAKNFFVLLVCHYILETLRTDPNGGVDSSGNKLPVRHAIFIEEAHNIISPSTEQSSFESVDPKISATAYIVKMLAEVRALRESIIIADQLPTALASEVTKNTGLKVVHRLSAQDDREQIGAAISATPVQLEQMGAFTTGKALLHHEKTQKPFEVQIAEWVPPILNYDPSNDYHLYQNILNSKTVIKSITTAFYNWQDDYLISITDGIEDLEKKSKSIEDKNIVNLSLCRSDCYLLITECRRVYKQFKRMEKLWHIDKMSNTSLQKEFKDVEDFIKIMIERLKRIKTKAEE